MQHLVAELQTVDAESSFDLDAVLRRHGLKDEDLSLVLGVSRTTIRLWRRGMRKPSVDHCKLAEKKLRIQRHELRPDLWSPIPRRARAA